MGRRALSFDGTVMDITEWERAEEALRESEARLGGILRRSPAGIVQTDAAGCMTLVNPEITHPSSVEVGALTKLLSSLKCADVLDVSASTAGAPRLASS